MLFIYQFALIISNQTDWEAMKRDNITYLQVLLPVPSLPPTFPPSHPHSAPLSPSPSLMYFHFP